MRGPMCTDQMELLQDMLIVVGRGINWQMLIVGPALCVCCAVLSHSVVSDFLPPHGL